MSEPTVPAEPVEPASAPTPSPATVKSRARARVALLLLTSGLAITLLPAPWNLTSLVFTSVALVVAILATVIAVRGRSGGPVVGGGMLLAGASVVGLLFGSSSILLVPAQMEYQQCRAEALTISADRACTQQYVKAVEDLQQRVLKSATP